MFYTHKTNQYNIIILSFFFGYVNTQKITIFDIAANILKQYRQNVVKILLIKLLYMTVNVVRTPKNTSKNDLNRKTYGIKGKKSMTRRGKNIFMRKNGRREESYKNGST